MSGKRSSLVWAEAAPEIAARQSRKRSTRSIGTSLKESTMSTNVDRRSCTRSSRSAHLSRLRRWPSPPRPSSPAPTLPPTPGEEGENKHPCCPCCPCPCLFPFSRCGGQGGGGRRG